MTKKTSTASQGQFARSGINLAVSSMGFFLVIGSHYLFKSGSGALVVKAFGAKGIPMIGLLDGALAIAVTFVLLLSAWTRARMSFLVFSVSLLAAGVLMVAPLVSAAPSPSRWFIVILNLAGSALISSGTYCLWMLVTSTMPERTWLVMAVFGAAGQCGMIAAGYVAPVITAAVGVSALPTVAAAGYIAAFLLAAVGIARFKCYGVVETADHPHEVLRASSLASVVAEVVRSPYLRFVSCALVLQVAFGDSLRWLIYAQAEQAQGLRAAADMLAGFYRYAAVICLVSQLALVPLLLYLVTPKYGLILQPIIGLFAAAAVALSGDPSVVFTIVAAYLAADYTVNNCFREALFIPVSLSAKVHSKSIIAMILPRLGGIAGSVIVLLFGRADSVVWYATMCVLAALWLWAAHIALAWYRRIEQGAKWESRRCVDEVQRPAFLARTGRP